MKSRPVMDLVLTSRSYIVEFGRVSPSDQSGAKSDVRVVCRTVKSAHTQSCTPIPRKMELSGDGRQGAMKPIARSLRCSVMFTIIRDSRAAPIAIGQAAEIGQRFGRAFGPACP
jgi:hypothetical protein